MAEFLNKTEINALLEVADDNVPIVKHNNYTVSIDFKNVSNYDFKDTIIDIIEAYGNCSIKELLNETN